MKNNPLLMLSLSGVLAMGILAGCSDSTEDAASNTANNAAKDIKNNADSAGTAVADAGVTGKVKSALMSAPGVDATGINVDTLDGNKVVLKGAVKTQEEKDKCESIAKDQAGSEYTIDNQLTVNKM